MFSDPPSDPISDPPTRKVAAIQTAKGPASYDVDWDGIEAAHAPCLATVKLLHVARQTVGTSRWCETCGGLKMRFSFIGRAGKLSPDKT